MQDYELASLNIMQEIESHQNEYQAQFSPGSMNVNAMFAEGNDRGSYPRNDQSSRTDNPLALQSENNSDNDYELCFVVEDVEFLTYKQGFILHSQYFRELLGTVQDNQIRILLPLWATANSFRIVLDFVNTGDIQRDIELTTIQNVLWLADFFQIHQLQRLCIDDFIVPRLTDQNVLTFLEDAFSKLSSCQEQQQKLQQDVNLNNTQQFEEQIQHYLQAEDIWYEFFNNCLDVCSQSLECLIKTKEKDLLNLPDTVVEEIIERALKLKSKTEDNELIKFMLKMKKINSPFELLELEKKRVIQTYDKLVHTKMMGHQISDPLHTASNQVKPLLTWKLSNLNLKQNFYKESDPFNVEGNQWILFITKMNDKECQVGVKYISSLEYQHYQMKKKFPVFESFSLISLLNWVRIESEPPLAQQSKDLLKVSNMITSHSKPQTMLRTIPLNLVSQKLFNAGLNIEIYFTIKHTVAAIMSYISANFNILTRDTQISRLTPQELQLLLMHQKLNVKSEDEVIDALISYFQRTGNFLNEKEMLDILKQVRWCYVSFDKLLEIFRSFSVLRHNIHMRSIFLSEIKYRAQKKANEVNYPVRSSYDTVMIETIFDSSYFLDKIGDYLFKIFDQQQMQSPSKAHLMNNSNILNQSMDLDTSKVYQNVNYKTSNKTFLEESYYQKLKELKVIEGELQKKQQLNLRQKQTLMNMHSADMNGGIVRSNILSPSSNNEQQKEDNKNNNNKILHGLSKSNSKSKTRYKQQNQSFSKYNYAHNQKLNDSDIRNSNNNQRLLTQNADQMPLQKSSAQNRGQFNNHQMQILNMTGDMQKDSEQMSMKLDNQSSQSKLNINRNNRTYLEDKNNLSIDYRRQPFNDNDLDYSGEHHLSFDVSLKKSTNNKIISTKGSKRYLNIANDDDDYDDNDNDTQQQYDSNNIKREFVMDISNDQDQQFYQVDEEYQNEDDDQEEEKNQEQDDDEIGDGVTDEANDHEDDEDEDSEPGIKKINRYTNDDDQIRDSTIQIRVRDLYGENRQKVQQNRSYQYNNDNFFRNKGEKKFLNNLNNSYVN